MTPRFRVDYRPSTNGWLGWVELDDGRRVVATGGSKAELLTELGRVVVKTTSLPLGSFELIQRASHVPPPPKVSQGWLPALLASVLGRAPR